MSIVSLRRRHTLKRASEEMPSKLRPSYITREIDGKLYLVGIQVDQFDPLGVAPETAKNPYGKVRPTYSWVERIVVEPPRYVDETLDDFVAQKYGSQYVVPRGGLGPRPRVEK